MCTHRSIQRCILTMLVLFLGISMTYGQTKQILLWNDSLEYSQKLSGKELEQQRDEVAKIRTSVEFWLRLHPNTTIKLAAAPAQPLNADQLKSEVSLLHDAVEAILKEDKGQSFDLGMTTVSITAEASPLSPVTDSIDHNEISNNHVINVADSVQYIPGIALDSKNNRNQAGITIRGFDTRQVGIYLDSIPITVPYDGYADINRFLASDIALIEVAKGYSSPLLGPNGLAGAVNIVTRQPEKSSKVMWSSARDRETGWNPDFILDRAGTNSFFAAAWTGSNKITFRSRETFQLLTTKPRGSTSQPMSA